MSRGRVARFARSRWALLAAAAPAAFLAARGVVRARVRRYETFDADAADLPGERVYIRGRRVHVTTEGAGPPLLLLHGFAASAGAFARIAPFLRDRYTLIAPDLPGHGYSDRTAGADYSLDGQAALMLDLLDRLGIERAAVLGHSTGAAIALRMAAARPAAVVALILAGGPGRLVPALPAPLRPLLALTLPFIVESGTAIRWFNRLTMGVAIDEASVQAHLAIARVPGHVATLATILTSRHGRPPLPEQITTPTLVLCGETDRYMPPARARAFAARLPNARAVVVPNAGHLVLDEQPERCAAEVVAFLDGIVRRTSHMEADTS